ncbi:glycosyl transferase [Gorgonomyces haynaldii]|nr:glycosyl transferase [Gorgonomyces haynaldii]
MKLLERLNTSTVLVFTLWIKYLVGLSGYSGENTPPMFGDFEAQRHWLEITFHLPIDKWYYYDLQYWGLDYPPLTAFHSYLLGWIGHLIKPEWVQLDASRGYSGPDLKLFMRLTALGTDLVIYTLACRTFTQHRHHKALFVLLCLLPTLVIIDHGHFQYNSAMLGFALLSFDCINNNRPLIGSIFFCFSLLFKQMALFYALPVFFMLLGQCVYISGFRGFYRLATIGLTVVSTFFFVLLPFGSLDTIGQIFVRIFPVQRGLYEDKVANLWCALSVIVKLRSILSLNNLMLLSIITTLCSVLVSGIHLMMNPKPKIFLYSLCVSSLGFFLFSFQVHEKSIMLPNLALALLFFDEPSVSLWFTNTAMYSLFPLLVRDKLVLPYFALLVLWNVLAGELWNYQSRIKPVLLLLHLTMFLSNLGHLFIPPPARYPDLHTVLNVLISTPQFLIIFVYLNYRQLEMSKKDKTE